MSVPLTGRLWDLPDPAAADPCSVVFDQANDAAKEILARWVNAWPELFEWQFSTEQTLGGLQISCTRVTMDHRVWTSRDVIPMTELDASYETAIAFRARKRYNEFSEAAAALARERERS